jgi:RecA/RadA recombinase
MDNIGLYLGVLIGIAVSYSFVCLERHISASIQAKNPEPAGDPETSEILRRFDERVRLEAKGDGNVQVANVSDSYVYIGVSVGPEPLQLERPVIPLGRRASPARSLAARSGVANVDVQSEVVERLRTWCVGRSVGLHITGMSGEGGSGKTGAAMHLCAQLENARWIAGFVPIGLEGVAQRDKDLGKQPHLLLVIDYADVWRKSVTAFLHRLAVSAASLEQVVCVLLLTRDGGDPRELFVGTSAMNESIAMDSERGKDLREFPIEGMQRQRFFRLTREKLAASPAVQVSAGFHMSDEAAPPPDLDSDLYSKPLPLVIAAYLSMFDDSSLPSTRSELVRALLRHEERYWEREGAPAALDEVMRRRIMALVMMSDRSTPADLRLLLSDIPSLRDESRLTLDAIVRWIQVCYGTGPSSNEVRPLVPHEFVDYLLFEAFRDDDEMLGDLIGGRTSLPYLEIIRALARAAATYPDLDLVVSAALSKELPALCNLVVDDASGSPHLFAEDADLVISIERLTYTAHPDQDAVERAVAAIDRFDWLRSDVLMRDPINELGITLTAQLIALLDGPRVTDRTGRIRLANTYEAYGAKLDRAGRDHESGEARLRAAEIRSDLPPEPPAPTRRPPRPDTDPPGPRPSLGLQPVAGYPEASIPSIRSTPPSVNRPTPGRGPRP